MLSSQAETQTQRGDQSCDIAIIGAGAVGLTTAIALARAGYSPCLIGKQAAARPGRTVALLDGSVRFLDALGLWPALRDLASPLKTMCLVDATDSLFRPPPVRFAAEEIGLPAFGFNIENGDLERVLADVARATPGIAIVPGLATAFAYDADSASIAVEGHGTIRARLVIAADGRHSLARKASLIGTHVRSYPQVALTAILSHDAPHREVSTEFHTRQGPFTLVPLPASASAMHRSSLVWVMSPDEAARRKRLTPGDFARAIEKQASSLLGTMTVTSEIGSFPIATVSARRLVGQRLVLTGEAAHALPPIGAQGLNLSFRDVATLTGLLAASLTRGEDPGAAGLLDRYAEIRRTDVAVRTFGVDVLNGSLLSGSIANDFLRGMGLTALGAIGPLRRLVMRRGLVPQGRAALTQGAPRLDVGETHRRSSIRS